MKAAVTERIGAGFVVQDIDIDRPIGREVLVDVRAVGLCHSDLTASQDDYGMPLPILHGHEVAGVVTEIGPEVTEFEVGDHIVTCLLGHCGTCLACRDGRPFECRNPGFVQRPTGSPPRLSRGGEQVFQGMDLGGFAEQILVHENNIVTVPADIPFAHACILGCGVVTGAGAVINSAGVRVGATVAVIGCGGLGLNAIQAARLAGATRIIAIDIAPHKLKLATQFGATDVIDSRTVDPAAAIRELCGGVDYAFEFVGHPSASETAVAVLGQGGQAFLVGLPAPGSTLALPLGFPLLERHIGVHGVKMGSANFKRDIPRFAELYRQGRFNLADLVSQEVSIEQINDAYASLKDGRVARSVVVF